MFPAAESAELPQDECSDQWKSPGQQAFSVPTSCSIDLLSGRVGCAVCPVVLFLVDERACGRTRLDQTLSLNRSFQRRSWTRSFALSYDFLWTYALVDVRACRCTCLWTMIALVDERAQIEHRSHMPNSVNCQGIVRNRTNARILFVANPVPAPLILCA